MKRRSLSDVIVVDFETGAIAPRPHYPPKPVGVALHVPGERPRYYAWGHASNNNCAQAEARRALASAWKSDLPKLFHHSKFDLDVAETHLYLPWLPWEKVHDTLFLAFLTNPHRERLNLKDVANEECGIAPKERDELRDWILKNVHGATKKSWGAYISQAPGDLVGRYAIGDLVRPLALLKKFLPIVEREGMLSAYECELRLSKVLIASERRGIRVDVPKIKRDIPLYEKAVLRADALIRKKLGASDDLDVSSTPQLADALDEAKAVTNWVLTAKGNRSTSKKNIESVIKDRTLFQLLAYRGAISTALSHFYRPWLRQAEETKGIIHTSWNQVRQDYHDAGSQDVGARSGRVTSKPNFQNLFKKFEESELASKLDGFPFGRFRLPPIPNIRACIVPRKNHVLIGRDYSQQELRILAHYEDGVLLAAYKENYLAWLADPKNVKWMDQHEYARQLINQLLGTNFPRRPIKDTGFGLIYGMGVGKLAKKTNQTVEMAKRVKDAYLKIFPGLKALDRELKTRGRADLPIRTWGGRLYRVEPPRAIDGRFRTFEYKLLNYLIQGSAADCTKKAMCFYGESGANGHLLLTVHDELLVEVKRSEWRREMKRLKYAMEAVRFDLPMLTDGKWSEKSWGEMIDLPKGE